MHLFRYLVVGAKKADGWIGRDGFFPGDCNGTKGQVSRGFQRERN